MPRRNADFPPATLSRDSVTLAKPVGTEALDRPVGGAVEDQVGEDLADDGGELETMAGARRGERDARRGRMAIDDERLVGRVRIQAYPRAGERAVGARHPGTEECPHPGDVGL